MGILTLCATATIGFCGYSSLALAQAANVQAEDTFREVFVTAGYSSAFGALAGLAMLPLWPGKPMDNMRFVTWGASVGFLGGSLYAFYSMNNRNSQRFYMTPSEPADDYGYGPSSTDPSLGMLKEPLPEGALVVGNGQRLGLRIPAFAIGTDTYEMRVLSMNF
jgi:hypothetical protein